MKTDWYLTIMTIIAIFVMVGSIVYSFLDVNHELDRKQIAADMGCEYVGSAYHLRSIAFYDCNGTVVTKHEK